MSELPQLLLAPESRKDKISKNDLRYLYRRGKGKERARKRAAVDSQIKTEKHDAERKRRLYNANGELKKLRKIVARVRGLGLTKAKMVPVQVMYKEGMDVFEGDIYVPCVFDDSSPNKTLSLVSERTGMTDDDVKQIDQKAVFFNNCDYPNLIPHDNLWVKCFKCHGWMRSTNIGYSHHTVWNIPLTKETQELTDYKLPANMRWRLYHLPCWNVAENKSSE